MVQINNWTIELIGNANCFTSYAGVEMRMIIHQMDIKKDYRVELKKALKDNIEKLNLLEQGQQITVDDPIVNLVINILDESKSGLIT